jgi:hypothetical protein
MRQARTEVYWTVQDYREERWSSLSIGVAAELSDVHNVFHVSQLKKCLCVPEEQAPMEDMDAKEDLSYQEYPVNILETSKRVTWNKKNKMCNVQWSHHTEEEATWEREEEATWESEEELKAEFPSFFSDPFESWGWHSF